MAFLSIKNANFCFIFNNSLRKINHLRLLQATHAYKTHQKLKKSKKDDIDRRSYFILSIVNTKYYKGLFAMVDPRSINCAGICIFMVEISYLSLVICASSTSIADFAIS